jgi:DNA-binding transcriptional ArsR family regulator
LSRPAASTDIFQAIADPTRRALLDRLRDGEQPVKQLAEPFNMSLPAISQHLQILCEAGLVQVRKAGRQRLYRLNPEPLKEVSDWITHYEQFWQEKLDALGKYLEENPCSET